MNLIGARWERVRLIALDDGGRNFLVPGQSRALHESLGK